MKNTFIKTLAALALIGFLSAPGFAEDAAAKGLKIAKEADKRDTGFVDNTAELLMILRNRQGQESKRNMKLKTLEQKVDGDKSMVVFNRPKDVKGTALLTSAIAMDKMTSGSTFQHSSASSGLLLATKPVPLWDQNSPMRTCPAKRWKSTNGNTLRMTEATS